MNRRSIPFVSVLFLIFSVLVLTGCAALSNRRDVLASVDGDPITVADLKYALNIAHRREDLLLPLS